MVPVEPEVKPSVGVAPPAALLLLVDSVLVEPVVVPVSVEPLEPG